ncbi:hypothetical protein MKZ38_009618 [Zalerion maritima]|uniref:Uncharacterized protein n=1 Tax=Zalerion maritima TaxID=339359 RepID=A0AAD5RGG0_9PEZI|nr:hypothetical protein MKZ38_009618 [Zalerion maritima]
MKDLMVLICGFWSLRIKMENIAENGNGKTTTVFDSACIPEETVRNRLLVRHGGRKDSLEDVPTNEESLFRGGTSRTTMLEGIKQIIQGVFSIIGTIGSARIRCAAVSLADLAFKSPAFKPANFVPVPDNSCGWIVFFRDKENI